MCKNKSQMVHYFFEDNWAPQEGNFSMFLLCSYKCAWLIWSNVQARAGHNKEYDSVKEREKLHICQWTHWSTVPFSEAKQRSSWNILLYQLRISCEIQVFSSLTWSFKACPTQEKQLHRVDEPFTSGFKETCYLILLGWFKRGSVLLDLVF